MALPLLRFQRRLSRNRSCRAANLIGIEMPPLSVRLCYPDGAEIAVMFIVILRIRQRQGHENTAATNTAEHQIADRNNKASLCTA